MTLDEFIDSEKKRLESFYKFWIQRQNAYGHIHYPDKMNHGDWIIEFQIYEEDE